MPGRKKNTARTSPTTSKDRTNKVASPNGESNDWRKITPAPLRPGVEALRKAFNRNRPSLDRMMKQDCWRGLHPALTGGPSLAESAVFKAHLTICANVIFEEAQKSFTEILTLGNAKADSLEIGPVEWAGLQTKILVEDEANRLVFWTKWACDKATVDDTNKAKNWRAPRWLAMYPMGAIAYKSISAWERLGANATVMVLEEHRKSFAELVNGWLESKIADAHVEAARRSSPPVKQATGGARALSESGASSKFKEHSEGALGSKEEIVDSFLNKASEHAGRRITRKDFWIVAGYSDRTQFQRFQSGKRQTESAATNFLRVLRMDPETFTRELEAKKARKNTTSC